MGGARVRVVAGALAPRRRCTGCNRRQRYRRLPCRGCNRRHEVLGDAEPPCVHIRIAARPARFLSLEIIICPLGGEQGGPGRPAPLWHGPSGRGRSLLFLGLELFQVVRRNVDLRLARSWAIFRSRGVSVAAHRLIRVLRVEVNRVVAVSVTKRLWPSVMTTE